MCGVILAAGCGKKGPPLTPIVRIPAAVVSLDARRAGEDVFVTFTVPAENVDGSMPASIARVDLYAATSLTPPPRARFLEIATLVGSVPVAPAADPGDPSAPVPAADPADGVGQGLTVTVRDPLEADDLTPRELRALEAGTPPRPVPAAIAAPIRPPVLRRFYMAIPFSARRQSGPPSPIAELPLHFVPEPPRQLAVAVTESQATLRWQPSGGLVGWLLDRSLPLEPPPLPLPPPPPPSAALTEDDPADIPAGPTAYNVYREVAPDPLALPDPNASPWASAAPAPVNPTPLAALTYDDPIATDGRQRCYHVRAVRGGVESAASERLCATPIDIHPPVTPTGLAAIVSEGAVNLIWEPNVETDLGGYLVLRRESGSDTLLQLTPAPIAATRFTDRGVSPGVRYTYEVRAVDTRVPLPNTSGAAQIVETAR